MASRTIRRLLQAKRATQAPWAPATARERYAIASRRQRQNAREVANGERCGTCGFPSDMPNCPDCLAGT